MQKRSFFGDKNFLSDKIVRFCKDFRRFCVLTLLPGWNNCYKPKFLVGPSINDVLQIITSLQPKKEGLDINEGFNLVLFHEAK